MSSHKAPFKIFTGNSNVPLAEEICQHLGLKLGDVLVTQFTNGETRVKVNESIRGIETFIVQPTCTPVNETLMELLIMIDALKRASASNITAVIPYYGYAKQEKKTTGREPITAKLVADLITVAGANRVMTIDLHAAAIQGFFNIPVDNLLGAPILLDYLKKYELEGSKVVIVSPDAGGVARVQNFALKLNCPLAIVFKRRPEPDESEVLEVVGSVENRTAIIVDDMISTGKTLVQAAEALLERGATDVYACATHAVLAGNSCELLAKSCIKEIIVTNTIPVPEEKRNHKIKVLSVGSLLAHAVFRIYQDQSISELFL